MKTSEASPTRQLGRTQRYGAQVLPNFDAASLAACKVCPSPGACANDEVYCRPPLPQDKARVTRILTDLRQRIDAINQDKPRRSGLAGRGCYRSPLKNQS